MVGSMFVVLGYTAVYQQAFTTLPIAIHAGGLPPSAYGLVMALNGSVIVIAWPLTSRLLASKNHSLVVAAGIMLTGAGFAVTALASSVLAYASAVSVWTLGEIAMAAASGPAGCAARPARRNPATAPRGAHALAHLRSSRRSGRARPTRPRASHPQPHQNQRHETASPVAR
jgi:hypothetical protein